MKNLKKLLCAALALSLSLALAACGDNGQTTGGSSAGAGEPSGDLPVIGINQFANHPSLDNCREGFLQGLTEAGLTEGTDYELLYQNADGTPETASQIAQNFSSQNVALMCAIATPSAAACYAAAEDKDIPVIFTAITDPVGAKLDSGNITGTSDVLPVEGQLDLIRQLQPNAKTIGIIYNTSEPNSVYSIGEYERLAGDYGFTIDKVGITSQSEVAQAVDTLISHEVDCLSNLTDNTVVDMLASILEKTNEAGIPVYGSEVEQVKNGCMAGAGLDYVQLGIQTGKMAAKVLKGEAACGDLPYEIIENYDLYINTDVLSAMGIAVPAEIAAKALEASEAATAA